jgi:hypothetical protein
VATHGHVPGGKKNKSKRLRHLTQGKAIRGLALRMRKKKSSSDFPLLLQSPIHPNSKTMMDTEHTEEIAENGK